MRRRNREHHPRRPSPRHRSRPSSFGNARCLVCRECRAEQPLGPFYACPECFGPLEVGYDFPADHPRVDRGRARRTSGATATCCRSAPTSPPSPTPSPGFTRLVKADNLARELGLRTPLGEGRLRQPDPLVQGPRRRGRAGRRARARPRGARLPVDRQPRQRRRRRRRPGRHQERRAHPGQPRAAQDPHHRRLRRHAARGQGQLRRRQQARLRDRRRGGRLGVRQRQRPAVLRRGLQDARLRGRRAARLAAARAGRHPGRLGFAADQGRQGLHRARRDSAWSSRRRTRSSARRRPGASRSRRRSATATT